MGHPARPSLLRDALTPGPRATRLDFPYVELSTQPQGVPALSRAFAVALAVGGSIVIPHLRRAVARLQELEER